jgi:phospholipid/cholesterol/gamma-HCH transport system ATP-binding protein
VITFDNVTKAFDGLPVLKGLTAQLSAEGITFIVGQSGSGKSVLCRLAVGLLKPDTGQVTAQGQRIDLLPERELQKVRAHMPYLVQGPALLDWLCLEDNVALASANSKADGRALEALRRVGLGDFTTRFPPAVGPGIRKRAAIARALVLSPRFLLLDEPTTGLDREAAGQVNDTLRTLRDEGLGAALVSHDYRALDALADHVIEVRDGKAGYQGGKSGFLSATV